MKSVYWSPSLEAPEAVLKKLDLELARYEPGDNLFVGESSMYVLTPAEAHEALFGGQPLVGQIIIWKTEEEAIPDELLQEPAIAGVLDDRCTDDTVYMMFRTLLASEGIENILAQVLEVGRALSSEKDLDTLFDLILDHARSLTGADGASIYTRDQSGQLFFRYWQNASIGDAARPQKIPVGEDSIAGYVAKTGVPLVIDDAYTIPEDSPFRFNSTSDRSIGYHTQSLLTVPLKNKENEVVGVLQLINRKRDSNIKLRTQLDCEKHVVPFDQDSYRLADALAGQAGIALENSILYQDIENLFEGFIRASVQAIEARDPTTAGHSFRVAEFTERLARAVDHADEKELRKITFSREEMREIRYAALLHDFGKVGVRENVLVKAKKLYPHQLEVVEQRIRLARLAVQRKAYADLIAVHDDRSLGQEEKHLRREQIEIWLAQQIDNIKRYEDIIMTANEPSVSHAEVSDDLAEVAAYTFPDESGEPVPLVTEFEFTDLSLPKGSLNSEEREEIESHVTHTYSFLTLIPWTRNLANLPDYAYGHHEKLDGTGYPRGLSGGQIPVQARMMTISDIYDALTAMDRPYKKAMPVEKALDILGYEAKAGKIDAKLFDIFLQSRAYELIEN